MTKKEYADKIADVLNIKRTKNDYNEVDGTINKHFLQKILESIENLKEKQKTI